MDGLVKTLPPEMPEPGDVVARSRGGRLLVMASRTGALGLVVLAWAVLSIIPTRGMEQAAAQRVADVAAQGLGLAGSALLREAWGVVSERFHDPELNGVDAQAVVAEFEGRAEGATTQAELRTVINESLGRLHASHTRLFTPDESAFYEVLDVFNPDGLQAGQIAGQRAGPVSYVGIGCVTREFEGRPFVTDVYPTGPADQAGLRVGDEIVSAAGQSWSPIAPFAGRAGEQTPLVVRRTQGMRALTLSVRPERIRPRELYLRALRASATEIERQGVRLGYVRLRSYAHQSYQDALVELMGGKFKDADGLVLDLRGGWGGARPEYTDAFNPAHPHMQMRGRSGGWNDVGRVWDRPLVVLIDEGTRSGKELVADALQRAGVATLVGTATAGAVLGGTTFPLSDGSLLMVAVADVRVDGQSLEGHPVEPDVLVERPIPYCNGADPQLEAGLEALVERIRAARPL